MRRSVPQQTEAVNSDSFLDIVASVVSIMIIMVVMEGMRIKNTPVQVAIPASPAATALQKDLAEEKALRGDVLKAAGEVQTLQRETAARTRQRDALATMASAAEHILQEHRKRIETTKQGDFDLARNISEAQFQLQQLAGQREQIEKTAATPVVVECYPTPLSRAVDGPEAHLLLSNGRAVFIPIETLLDEFQVQARRQAHRLADQDEVTDTVGPIEGFRLRYTLERHEVAAEVSGNKVHRGGSYARLQKWTIIPIANDIGEPVRLALEPDSEFHRTLKKIQPARTTITIWVYPDGFDAFREIRKELYRLGYTIAARPLPPGTPITGSPEGSKSAAQ
jgi:hypothetical protein